MTAIRLEDVWFSYHDHAVLRGVTLTIRLGETVGLLGRNGVGKTTLTKLLAAILHPTRGTVWIGEQATAGKAPEEVANWVAYVFQHADQQLFARTVLDEVAFAPRQRGLDESDARALAASALEEVRLGALASAHPYDLPPPQRKLVALAAALAQASQVLVLDEPTLGLDRDGRGVVCRVAQDAAARGVAVLAVSHDLEFVANSVERTLVLEEGGVVYDGACRDLILDAARLAALGLEMPPAACLSRALRFPGVPVRFDAVATVLAERCRDLEGSVTSRFSDDQS